jgi:hypothetical protein
MQCVDFVTEREQRLINCHSEYSGGCCRGSRSLGGGLLVPFRVEIRCYQPDLPSSPEGIEHSLRFCIKADNI